MKPILVQQQSNGTLWWVVDCKISIWSTSSWGWGKKMHRVYTLISADERNGHGSRLDWDTYYTFISN